MKINYESPVLYSRSKSGQLRFWQVSATSDGKVKFYYGNYGTPRPSHRSYRARPTNVGRSNKRTAAEQAAFEARAACEHKLARKYSLTQQGAQEQLDYLPMLAKSFVEGNLGFPAAIQPKLDGFRCLARWEDGQVLLTSRQGKEFELPHIAEALEPVLGRTDVILDGELYIHGEPLQRIASLIRRHQDETERIKYFPYDIVNGDEFQVRWDALEAVLSPLDDPAVEMCPTYLVESEDQAREWQGVFLSEGFEGAVLRSLTGIYRQGHRSGSLLKMKQFIDEEFLITGVKEGKNKMAVLTCHAPGGEFGVTFGSHEERREQLRRPELFIGRKLTVRFSGWTRDKKPFHPTGVVIREDWD